MRKAAIIILLLPVLLFATSYSGVLEGTAYAQRGHGGGGHYAGRGGGGGHYAGRGGGGGYYRGGGGYYRGGGGYYRGGGGHYGGHGGHHGGHFSGGIFIGGPWFWDPFYYPFYPYYAYPYAYPYSSSPTVIIQQPEEYMTPVNPNQGGQGSYWYYCKDAKGYYPYVKSCPGGWMQVVPNTSPPSHDFEGD